VPSRTATTYVSGPPYFLTDITKYFDAIAPHGKRATSRR
jgi:hypothetical protein